MGILCLAVLELGTENNLLDLTHLRTEHLDLDQLVSKIGKDTTGVPQVYLYSNIVAIADLAAVEASFEQNGVVDLPHGCAKRLRGLRSPKRSLPGPSRVHLKSETIGVFLGEPARRRHEQLQYLHIFAALMPRRYLVGLE